MADAQERIGQIIGDYRLLRLLGKGTFGTVYLAEHLHDHTSAAVKVLHIPLTTRDDLRAFLKEARTMRLRHPHIVPILDFDLNHSDDLPYLVMAYAEGGTVRDRYPKGSKLPHETIDTYVQQLASALQYAHDHRVIHRDIKPENILVYPDGTVQLSDFGIAKISELISLSTHQRAIGTPAYAAPEQSLGKPCPASDQYALAVVVYEWFAGQRPFQGDHFALMFQHRTNTPPSLCTLCPEVSPLVEQVIFKALAKAPEDRFPTVTHFAQALHIALQEDTVPWQLFPNQGVPQSAYSPTIPVSSPNALLSDTLPPEASLTPTKTSPPQPIPTSLPSANTTDAKPIEQPPSPWPPPVPQKQSSTNHLARALIVLLCLALLLGGGGAIWFVASQQQANPVPVTTHSATATVAPPLATATAAVNTYWTEIARNGVQFGFDAARTHWNPYERVLSAANVAQMTQLWSYTTSHNIFPSPAVANGMVYVGSSDHTFYAFDAACHHDCQPLWSSTTGDLIDSSPAVANGMVYVGSDDHTFYAFDATCRSACPPLWSYTAGERIASSPAVANGMVYVGSYDSKFYAFDATCRRDCQPLWSFTAGGPVSSSPAVANGLVYISSDDHKLYAFDATCRHNCQPLWSFTVSENGLTAPAATSSMIYVGSLDGKLYAFDTACRTSCQPRWSFQTGDSIKYSSPAVANGMVYVGSADGKLYAFDAACRTACQPLWSFQTGNSINSSPAVANDVIYVGSDNGKLYAFDATCHTGCQPLLSLTVGTSGLSSPTVANGVLYVGSNDGNLYALGLSTLS